MARSFRSVLHSGLHRVGLDLVRWPDPTDRVPSYPPDFNQTQRDTLSKVVPYTMTSPERTVALIDAVEYIHRANVPGSVVECGVWKGGSMMAAALTLLRLGDHRDLYLYDTFDGMTEPTAYDVDVYGHKAADLLREQARTTSAKSIWCYAPLQGVREAIETTGYPESLVQFVKGPVEETIPKTVPDQISLLRLDTDWYESTRHELEHLYPLLAPGGVLIIDDYGHHLGCRKATDEYLARLPKPVLLSRIDYTGRMTVKR
jgi:O-methyltransferase